MGAPTKEEGRGGSRRRGDGASGPMGYAQGRWEIGSIRFWPCGCELLWLDVEEKKKIKIRFRDLI